MAKITHNSDEFNGRIANVQFAAGKAETENAGSISYFLRRSETYSVDLGSDGLPSVPDPDAEDEAEDQNPPAPAKKAAKKKPAKKAASSR